MREVHGEPIEVDRGVHVVGGHYEGAKSALSNYEFNPDVV